MADDISVRVRHEKGTYAAGIHRDDRADQLLMKSLHHFGIDPREKTSWQLSRGDQRLVLDHPIGDQVDNGSEVRLEPDTVDRKEPSTGSY